jgi:surface protein
MKNILLTFIVYFVCHFSTSAQFITTWKTDNPGSSGNQIIIPVDGTNYEISWWLKSDSTQVNGTTIASGSNFTLNLPQAGTYGIAISKGEGTLNYIRFNGGGDRLKILEINQWGNNPWTSMEVAFLACSNLTISATDTPDLTQLNNLSHMFSRCSKIEQIPNIQTWDVSNVTNMGFMFHNASQFNQPLNNWDVSNVTRMSCMFYRASQFNQPLNDWDVSNVIDMSYMFYNASQFNQTLNDWDVSQVTDMMYMFQYAQSFNQSLSNWNLSSLKSNALQMMMPSSGIDCANLARTLQGWAENTATPNGIVFGAESLPYAAQGSSALTTLANKGWNITIGAPVSCLAYDAFITIWKTDNTGSASNKIILPITGTNYDIYWERVSDTSVNGNMTTVGNSSGQTIEFPEPGMYRVYVSQGDGKVSSFSFNGEGDRLKLLEVSNWGTIPWTTMLRAFYNCSNLKISATDMPDLTQLDNLFAMFRGCSQIEQIPYIQNWDVSKVTNMSYLFSEATLFNQPLNNWDVSNVTNMSHIFFDASLFNQPLNNWDVSNVTNMSNMFYLASAFNQPINNWDVRNVTNMYGMFSTTSKFDQPLSDWDISKVTNISYMFNFATSFNHPLNNWNITKVTNITGVFNGAYAFNQPLNDWDVSSVTDMTYMFNYSGMDCANITHTLQGWAANSQLPSNITLGARGISYASQAKDALNILRNEKGWTVNIGSEVECSALPVTLVNFKALQQESTVRLDWSTASEQDHDYFEVQRSVDGKNWATLAQVLGNGTVSSLKKYEYLDTTPLAGTTYYRLKIVDIAGNADHSSLVAVQIETLPVSYLYPNPAHDHMTLKDYTTGLIKIYNTAGRLVKQFHISTRQETVDISDLSVGHYILQTIDGKTSHLIKSK